MKVSKAKCPGSVRSNVEQSWHAIDWQRAEQNVRGIQTRITKATQGGKWRRVKSLQRMLSRSFCGKAMVPEEFPDDVDTGQRQRDRQRDDQPQGHAREFLDKRVPVPDTRLPLSQGNALIRHGKSV